MTSNTGRSSFMRLLFAQFHFNATCKIRSTFRLRTIILGLMQSATDDTRHFLV